MPGNAVVCAITVCRAASCSSVLISLAASGAAAVTWLGGRTGGASTGTGWWDAHPSAIPATRKAIAV
jgi:hypothetical protein